MQIRFESTDRRSFVSLAPNLDLDWPSFRIEAVVDLGHSTFSASNGDVALTHLAAFVDQLDRFITDRSLRPRLDGTYDTFLELDAKGRVVMLSFRVGGVSVAAGGNLSGSFELDEAALLPLKTELARLRGERH